MQAYEKLTRPQYIYAYFMLLVCLASAGFSAGCSGNEGAPDFQLNVSSPQVEQKTATVNGGVVAPVDRIQWEWGDGKTDSHLFFPANHTYAAPGQYKITVTVFDSRNFSAAKTVIADIK